MDQINSTQSCRGRKIPGRLQWPYIWHLKEHASYEYEHNATDISISYHEGQYIA